jgi:peroxiredoxin
MLKIGKKAPDFNLSSGEGKKYSLKDFAGRKFLSKGQYIWLY